MKNLLYIIKHDRQVVITLLVVFIALGVIVLEFCTSEGTKQGTTTNTETETNTRTETEGEKDEDSKYYAVPAKELHLQTFDPNTADSTLLLGLGLRPWQVRNIYKYRAAGGVYTRPEDFARTYGLSLKKYKELRPYIVIGKDYRPAAESVKSDVAYHETEHYISSSTNKEKENATSSRPTKIKAGETIAVNTADTAALQRVPGIGPYFAKKIAKQRDILGGFVSKDQLLEIEGFPESALPYLAIDCSVIRKLNINKATAEQLRKHPYITYMMARQIMDYRRLRGNIQNINDLSLLPNFTKETINKLRPYIEY